MEELPLYTDEYYEYKNYFESAKTSNGIDF
jgi:hypothetical protein